MKIIRRMIFLLIFVGVLGYAAYHFGTTYVSEKASAAISEQLNSNEQITEMKQTIETIPEVQTFVNEGADIEPSTLVFTTKEAAAKVIMKKVGISELNNMYTEYQHGMSEKDIKNVFAELENKLTAEEIIALKALAYKELNP